MNYLCLSLSGTSTGCLLCTYSGMPKHFLSALEKRFVLPYRCTPQLLGYMDATFRARWTIPTLQHLLQRNGVYPKPTRKTPCFRALFRFLKQREREITIMLNIFENYIHNLQGLEIIIKWFKKKHFLFHFIKKSLDRKSIPAIHTHILVAKAMAPSLLLWINDQVNC